MLFVDGPSTCSTTSPKWQMAVILKESINLNNSLTDHHEIWHVGSRIGG